VLFITLSFPFLSSTLAACRWDLSPVPKKMNLSEAGVFDLIDRRGFHFLSLSADFVRSASATAHRDPEPFFPLS